MWTELGGPTTLADGGLPRRWVLGGTLAAASAGSLTVALLLTAGRTELALLLATGLGTAAVASLGTMTVQHRLGTQFDRRRRA